MAVPKRKVSKARRNKRSATWGIRPQSVNLCFSGSCQGEPKLPHQVCLKCGFYNDEKILMTKQERSAKRAEQRAAQQAKQPAGNEEYSRENE